MSGYVVGADVGIVGALKAALVHEPDRGVVAVAEHTVSRCIVHARTGPKTTPRTGIIALASLRYPRC